MTTEWKNSWRKSWIDKIKRQTIEKYNKLLKGNISVSQAHAERDEIVNYFNALAEDLEEIVKERDEALKQLEETQKELTKYRRN